MDRYASIGSLHNEVTCIQGYCEQTHKAHCILIHHYMFYSAMRNRTTSLKNISDNYKDNPEWIPSSVNIWEDEDGLQVNNTISGYCWSAATLRWALYDRLVIFTFGECWCNGIISSIQKKKLKINVLTYYPGEEKSKKNTNKHIQLARKGVLILQENPLFIFLHSIVIYAITLLTTFNNVTAHLTKPCMIDERWFKQETHFHPNTPYPVHTQMCR